MSAGGVDKVDFTGRGTHILLWAYIVASGILAVWSMDEISTPWPTVLGLGVLVVIGILLTADTATPVRLSTALISAVAWTIVALASTWYIVVPGGHAQWYYGAGTVTMFFLALRGRLGIAWLGFGAQSAVIVVWGLTTDVGLIVSLFLIGKQLAILLVGTLFTVGLRRADATLRRLAEQTSARAMLEAAGLASTAERNERLQELDALATPLLARIVDGGPLTPEDRVEFAVAEAELRDGLRARALASADVVAAARAARRRGVEVVLLDDRNPEALDDATLRAVMADIVQALDAATAGRVVARLLPPGRDAAATILSDTGTRQEHHGVPYAGHP
ncbi:hypothetical protein M2152_000067 [Microbacteriaceae bacterium SG_E_30_P1]|uniref:Uncharacterized protein n=1 Tax=Antiquaquibacter oligotrophicus TaxID=2880260 RepID=A0ABT6KJ32_9MICO|nr:hypothetical protein [Antiquaquibacter oligotrophicus]MDH6179885.1 hypothetical protein [Antiquaquibacter oligotrophicus]UDF14354.1 hypothetical protein LH407_05695 [Antiquaquibacter oligotrophicus]